MKLIQTRLKEKNNYKDLINMTFVTLFRRISSIFLFKKRGQGASDSFLLEFTLDNENELDYLCREKQKCLGINLQIMYMIYEVYTRRQCLLSPVVCTDTTTDIIFVKNKK